jgi:hypothetical protein
MIYSYNKSQRDALFLTFIFGKELCMFRTDLLSTIRSVNTVYTAVGISHASYVNCLLARSGWNILTSLAVLTLLMVDSRSVQNMQSSLPKINLKNSASYWLLL